MKVRFLQARASNGCRNLVSSLSSLGIDARRTKADGSTYRGFLNHLVINWGRSDRGILKEAITPLNPFDKVAIASSKINTFHTLKDELSNNIPKFTEDIEKAREWISQGFKVYCRTLTRGSQGRGIVVASTLDELVSAPLYTQGVDVDREVRVHVFRSSVIDFAQKKKMGSERREEENIEVNEDIRSHSNGWIFAREGVEIPEDAKAVAIKAIETIGLDFGAVDMAITPQGVPKVYEVNTAPGLEGTTLERYRDAIASLV